VKEYIKNQIDKNAEVLAEQLEKGKSLRLWVNKENALRASVENHKPIELKN